MKKINKKQKQFFSCPTCKKGNLQQKKIDIVYNYCGLKSLNRDVIVCCCDNCDEEVLPDSEASKIEKKAKDAFYKKYPGRFSLRVSPYIHYKLIQKSKQNGRSLNQEIVSILNETLK